MKSNIRVAGIYYYPVKSCRGISAQTAQVTATGFANDRRLMLVDRDGKFLSQRTHPLMARIKPKIDDELLILSAPGISSVKIRLQTTGKKQYVKIWQDQCVAVDQGEAAADWFSGVLKTPCRLVQIAPRFQRKIEPTYNTNPDSHVGFADAYPFLLISEASLQDLNSRLAKPLPLDRFRANIVVSGCDAYEEDRWKRIKIGPVAFDIVKPCVRCVITTTDQKTAKVGKEPLRTLAKYRNLSGKGVEFGQNMIHNNMGEIRIGDRMKIMEER